MTEQVYLNGAGLVTSLGASLVETARAYRASKRAFFKDPAVIGSDGLAVTYAPVIPVGDQRDPLLRIQALIRDALADLVSQIGPGERPTLLVLHLPEWLRAFEPGLSTEDWPGSAISSRMPEIELLWNDRITLPAALEQAQRGVAQNPVAQTVIVAADTFLHPSLLDRLTAANRLLSRSQPHGLVPSEAAVALRLTSGEAVDFSAPTGWLDGHWSGRETQDVRKPDGMLGDALAQTLAAAAAHAPGHRLMVDLNGERWRSEEAGMALSRTGDLAPELATDFETPVTFTGDCGSAMAGVMIALGLAPGPIPSPPDRKRERSLIVSCSFDGQRDTVGLVRDTASGTGPGQEPP